jgi:hypothetical protein
MEMSTTPRFESVAFTLEEGEVTRHPSGSRTALRFAAPAKRHLDGGFEVDVNVVLFDAQGRFVYRRSGDRSRTVLANRAFWIHEIDNDCLVSASQMVYEISHRFDFRRKITAGELPELPAQADGSDYYRWLNLDPRTLEDRAIKLDFALWARHSSLEITMSQHPKLVTDSCRTEWELDLLDADRAVCFVRTGSVSLNYGQPAYDDTSISMDRRSLRMLKFYELRGRTEIRAISRFAIDALPA